MASSQENLEHGLRRFRSNHRVDEDEHEKSRAARMRSAFRSSFMRRHWVQPDWIIDPRTSRHIAKWDSLVAVCLIVTATLTPFEVAFLDPPTRYSDRIFLLNRVIDMIFICDIILQFLQMYPETSDEQGAHWVMSPKKIALHYLGGWFTIDFICIAVSSVEFVAIARSGASSESREDDELATLQLLRNLRALRLVKLVRLMRASRMAKHWEVRMAVNYSSLALLKSIVGFWLLAHWFACLWGLQTIFSDSINDTWMGNKGFCAVVAPEYDAVVDSTSSPDEEIVCKPVEVLYMASLYWAVMTIVSRPPSNPCAPAAVTRLLTACLPAYRDNRRLLGMATSQPRRTTGGSSSSARCSWGLVPFCGLRSSRFL